MPWHRSEVEGRAKCQKSIKNTNSVHFVRWNTVHLYLPQGQLEGAELDHSCLCGFEQTHCKQSGSKSCYSLITRVQKSKQKPHPGAACGRESCAQAVVSWVKFKICLLVLKLVCFSINHCHMLWILKGERREGGKGERVRREREAGRESPFSFYP